MEQQEEIQHLKQVNKYLLKEVKDKQQQLETIMQEIIILKQKKQNY